MAGDYEEPEGWQGTEEREGWQGTVRSWMDGRGP